MKPTGSGSSATGIVPRLIALLEDDSSPLLEKVEKFCFDKCDEFAAVEPRTSSAAPITEYPLVLSEVHALYAALVEAEMQSFLRDEHIPPGELLRMLKRDEAAREQADRLIRIVESLLDIGGFSSVCSRLINL